jgi:hypothetical protein
LATKVMVRSANNSASPMPAAMAASTPSSGEPVTNAAPKPHTAPITIMPSTPRLSTPERSETSSPRAASNSGVAAVMMVRMTASSPLMAVTPPGPGAVRAAAVSNRTR